MFRNSSQLFIRRPVDHVVGVTAMIGLASNRPATEACLATKVEISRLRFGKNAETTLEKTEKGVISTGIRLFFRRLERRNLYTAPPLPQAGRMDLFYRKWI